jgi:hypothetical protein
MCKVLETIVYKGYKIEVHQDENGHSPREWDNLGHMVCWHSRYKLGDEHDFANNDDFKKYIKESTHVILPVYLYDHSGLSMNTTGFNCKWDSGQVGWIYVSHEKIRKEYGWDRVSNQRKLKIMEYLRLEVETYNDYLTGNVFGYNIPGIDESCWGFYGNTGRESMISECKDIIDNHIKFITQPDDIISIRDNNGRTKDRYTIFFDGDKVNFAFGSLALGLSTDPGSPQGFSQWSVDAIDGDHLGERISWTDLPSNVRTHVLSRINNRTE